MNLKQSYSKWAISPHCGHSRPSEGWQKAQRKFEGVEVFYGSDGLCKNKAKKKL